MLTFFQCKKLARTGLNKFFATVKKLSKNRFQFLQFRKTAKKIEGGDPLGKKFFRKKSLAVPKKMKGGVFGLARYGLLRGKTGKTFLVQFARPNSAF